MSYDIYMQMPQLEKDDAEPKMGKAEKDQHHQYQLPRLQG